MANVGLQCLRGNKTKKFKKSGGVWLMCMITDVVDDKTPCRDRRCAISASSSKPTIESSRKSVQGLSQGRLGFLKGLVDVFGMHHIACTDRQKVEEFYNETWSIFYNILIKNHSILMF